MTLWCVSVLLSRVKRNGDIKVMINHGPVLCDDEATAIGVFVKDSTERLPGYSILFIQAIPVENEMIGDALIEIANSNPLPQQSSEKNKD